MPRIAPPRDGDLPVFPSAQQYKGTTEVHTAPVQARVVSGSSAAAGQSRQRPPQETHVPHRTSEHAHHLPDSHAQASRQQLDRQQAPSPRLATQRVASQPGAQSRQVDPRHYTTETRHHSSRPDSGRLPPPPTEDMRRLHVQEQRGTHNADYANPNARRPVMGVQNPVGRASPHDFNNTNFVGQPFGIVPEDNSRAPPYDPVLWKIFCQVDSDGSGAITQTELAHALINGDFTPFHVDTIALMIRLFDEDRNGTVSFAEFEKLWKYLLEWKALFSRFDIDHSGTISFPEFSEALSAFGYRLTTSFVQFLFRYHDKHRTKEMSFDLFVQSCVTLKLFTDVFRKFDTDTDGVITIGFEDFLKVMIKNR